MGSKINLSPYSLEIVILRKVLMPKLIAVFIAVVGLGILLVGYLFNIII